MRPAVRVCPPLCGSVLVAVRFGFAPPSRGCASGKVRFAARFGFAPLSPAPVPLSRSRGFAPSSPPAPAPPGAPAASAPRLRRFAGYALAVPVPLDTIRNNSNNTLDRPRPHPFSGFSRLAPRSRGFVRVLWGALPARRGRRVYREVSGASVGKSVDTAENRNSSKNGKKWQKSNHFGAKWLKSEAL